MPSMPQAPTPRYDDCSADRLCSSRANTRANHGRRHLPGSAGCNLTLMCCELSAGIMLRPHVEPIGDYISREHNKRHRVQLSGYLGPPDLFHSQGLTNDRP